MAGIASDPTILSSKRALYIGGLAENVTGTILRAAFVPFGEIKSIDIPMDYVEGKHRGFGFVEFEDADDASEAMFNMDGANLMGRTINVSIAQLNQINKLSGGPQGAVWDSDEWFQQNVAAQSKSREQIDKEKDSQVLQEEMAG